MVDNYDDAKQSTIAVITSSGDYQQEARDLEGARAEGDGPDVVQGPARTRTKKQQMHEMIAGFELEVIANRVREK